MSPGKSNPSFPCCWNTIIPSLSKCPTDHNKSFGKCEFINILITLAISEVKNLYDEEKQIILSLELNLQEF